MNSPLQPSTPAELVEAVKSAPLVIPIGAGTKPSLGAVPGAVAISTTRLSGIMEYDPGEFTFTARAGTPLREIIAVLAERGQYLPFDPPFAAAGATLGGTVASGLNGSGRLRFGGVRDFILGVRFVDGTGQLLRMGGKVVKNAAGFDLPKFFVGSLGRFGILADLTFKVFPRRDATLTLEFTVQNDEVMARLLGAAVSGRWEVEALDASPAERKVYARLAGPAGALQQLAADLVRRWPGEILSPDAGEALWRAADEYAWAHARGPLCKVPLTLERLPAFAALTRRFPSARVWIGAAGSVGFLSLPESADLRGVDEQLHENGFRALVFRGSHALWLGIAPDLRIHAAVKQALDPANRFPFLC